MSSIHRGVWNEGAVHVGMAIGRDDHGAGEGVALLAHHLMTDSPTGRVRIDPVLVGKFLTLRASDQCHVRVLGSEECRW
jgi:hypothetical protein